jgi:hypothetical protein
MTADLLRVSKTSLSANTPFVLIGIAIQYLVSLLQPSQELYELDFYVERL